MQKKVAQIRIAGPDRKGIISAVTSYLSANNCNIEDIDQRIHDGFLVMNMQVDTSDLKKPTGIFLKDLKLAAKGVGCEAEYRPVEHKLEKNVAILVSKESHCLEDLIKNLKKTKGKIKIVIGNHSDLRSVAQKNKIPFFHIPSENKKVHEEEVVKLLIQNEIDLVVLARYMQVLSPDFVFRYEGRIINIHPSLLPAFPGPRPYHQAFNKGVEVVGVTAHFVTTDLDEGPIIAQDAVSVDKTQDCVEDFIKKGQAMEARVLTRAVRLFIEDRLCLRRGKVIDRRKIKEYFDKTRSSYCERD